MNGQAQLLSFGVAFYAFLFAATGLLLSAGLWVVGAFSNNYTQSVNGKKGLLICAGGAMCVGSMGALTNFFGAGSSAVGRELLALRRELLPLLVSATLFVSASSLLRRDVTSRHVRRGLQVAVVLGLSLLGRFRTMLRLLDELARRTLASWSISGALLMIRSASQLLPKERADDYKEEWASELELLSEDSDRLRLSQAASVLRNALKLRRVLQSEPGDGHGATPLTGSDPRREGTSRSRKWWIKPITIGVLTAVSIFIACLLGPIVEGRPLLPLFLILSGLASLSAGTAAAWETWPKKE